MISINDLSVGKKLSSRNLVFRKPCPVVVDWISYVIFRWVIAIKSAKASKYQPYLISHEFCSAWYTALLVNLQISDFSGWQEGELVPQIWISGRCSIRNTFRKYHIFSTNLLSHLFRPHKTTEIRIWHWRKYKKTTEPSIYLIVAYWKNGSICAIICLG